MVSQNQTPPLLEVPFFLLLLPQTLTLSTPSPLKLTAVLWHKHPPLTETCYYLFLTLGSQVYGTVWYDCSTVLYGTAQSHSTVQYNTGSWLVRFDTRDCGWLCSSTRTTSLTLLSLSPALLGSLKPTTPAVKPKELGLLLTVITPLRFY